MVRLRGLHRSELILHFVLKLCTLLLGFWGVRIVFEFGYDAYLSELFEAIRNLDKCEANSVVQRIREVKKKNAQVFIFGNGGSAAIASHAVVDLNKAAGVKSLCFTDPSLLTCFANDFGYENAYAQALKHHGTSNDLVIVISSSGQSENMIRVAKMAKQLSCGLVTFSGFASDNLLKSMGSENFYCPSMKYNMVENTHQVWLLAIIDAFIASNQ